MAALRHAARGLVGGQTQAVFKAAASPLLAHGGRTASSPLLRSLSSSSSGEPVYVEAETLPDPERARQMAEIDSRKRELFNLLADMDARRPRGMYTCTADVYEASPTASSDTPALIPMIAPSAAPAAQLSEKKDQ